MKRLLTGGLLATLVIVLAGCTTTTPGGLRTHPSSQDKTVGAPVNVQTHGKMRTRANVLYQR